MMFEVGDKVKYVSTEGPPDYQNLGVGVVIQVGVGSFWSVDVVFEGFDYSGDDDVLYPYHPCSLDELEKV
jgi:hypothetical protein